MAMIYEVILYGESREFKYSHALVMSTSLVQQKLATEAGKPQQKLFT